jgi:hypothetical protein
MGTAAIVPAILGLSAVSGLVSTVGAYREASAAKASAESQAQAAEEAARYEAAVAGQNAQLAAREARDAEARGRDEEDRYRRQLAQLLGTQRVQTASLGLDLASGSSAEALLVDTSAEGARDIDAIRQDAAREAYAARVGEAGAQGQQGLALATARNARINAGQGISPGLAAFTTALGSATQFSTAYYALGGFSGGGGAAGKTTAAAGASLAQPTMRPSSPWARRRTRAPGQLYGDAV